MNWRSWIVVVASASFSSSVVAQPPRVSAPSDDYLVDITRMAARESRIADLQSRRIQDEDVELRFWGGYGLTGTHGLLLRRTGGVWTLQLVELERCNLVVPMAGGDTLSAASVAEYEHRAVQQCEQRSKGAGRVFMGYRLRFGGIAKEGDLNSLWKQLLAAGLAQLPPQVERTPSNDGHSFVIEFRVLNEYRVSEIQCAQTLETTTDRQVRRIGLLLLSLAPDASWLRCH